MPRTYKRKIKSRRISYSEETLKQAVEAVRSYDIPESLQDIQRSSKYITQACYGWCQKVRPPYTFFNNDQRKALHDRFLFLCKTLFLMTIQDFPSAVYRFALKLHQRKQIKVILENWNRPTDGLDSRKDSMIFFCGLRAEGFNQERETNFFE